MTRDLIIQALALPSQAHVGKRVPKNLLIQNGAPTAADRKAITEGIEELIWVASMKSSTVGIPVYRDAEREVLEIAVLSLNLRADAKADRIFELIHRAIPYPVFLVAEQKGVVSVSVAAKRFSQGDSAKWVLDHPVVTQCVSEGPAADRFLAELSPHKRRDKSLQQRYDGLLSAVVVYQVDLLIGELVVYDEKSTAARIESLEAYRALEQELASAKAEARRESMLSRQVELNQRIKGLEAQLRYATDSLKGKHN